jgi:hypothetical protein
VMNSEDAKEGIKSSVRTANRGFHRVLHRSRRRSSGRNAAMMSASRQALTEPLKSFFDTQPDSRRRAAFGFRPARHRSGRIPRSRSHWHRNSPLHRPALGGGSPGLDRLCRPAYPADPVVLAAPIGLEDQPRL